MGHNLWREHLWRKRVREERDSGGSSYWIRLWSQPEAQLQPDLWGTLKHKLYRWADPTLRPEGLRFVCSRQLIVNHWRLSPQAASTFSAVLLSFFEQRQFSGDVRPLWVITGSSVSNWGSACSLVHGAWLAPCPACYKHHSCPAA